MSVTSPVMNSLVSPTKVITATGASNKIATNVSNISLPQKIPISSLTVPIVKMKDDEVDFDTDPIVSNNVDEINEILNDASNISEDTPILNNEADVLLDSTVNENQDNEDVAIKDAFEEATKNPPIIEEPMDCALSPKEILRTPFEDVQMQETSSQQPSPATIHMESSDTSIISNNGDHLLVGKHDKRITADDLLLLCDMFYLPFEHGSKALFILNEFYWLKTNATMVVTHLTKKEDLIAKPEKQEWNRRAEGFYNICHAVREFAKKISLCDNREICYDLYSYVWEINGVTTMLNAYVQWLSLGKFPTNINSYIMGSYTC